MDEFSASAGGFVFGQPDSDLPSLSEPVLEKQRLWSPILPLAVAVGILFLWAAFLPLYRWYHCLIALALAVAGFLLTLLCEAPVYVSVPVTGKLPKSPDRSVNRMLKQGRAFLEAQLYYSRALARSDAELSALVAQISSYGYQMLSCVAIHPDRAAYLSDCLSFDFPALEMLLSDYRSDVTDKAGLQSKRVEAIHSLLPLIRLRRDACYRPVDPESVSALQKSWEAFAALLDVVPEEDSKLAK